VAAYIVPWHHWIALTDVIIHPLRDEHRLRVFENRVLRGIFGPKTDEVTGEWRKLLSGELHNLYSSPDIIRRSNKGE
jgi:hypothetical protein